MHRNRWACYMHIMFNELVFKVYRVILGLSGFYSLVTHSYQITDIAGVPCVACVAALWVVN